MSLSLDGTTGISASGNITGGNVIASGALVVGSFAPSSLSTTGNVSGGNILTVGLISSTGNITGGIVSATGNISGNYILGNGSQLTGIAASYGNANVVTLLAAFGSNSISTTGNITAANLNTPTGDLAEMYCADAKYAHGTVVEFGGAEEITIATSSHSTRVAGIVSTDPSYLMNSTLECENSVAVALTGRVPCQVVGSIFKGDRLVSSGLYPGVASVLDPAQYHPGCIIGKALENYQSTEVGVIEVAVGRF